MTELEEKIVADAHRVIARLPVNFMKKYPGVHALYIPLSIAINTRLKYNVIAGVFDEICYDKIVGVKGETSVEDYEKNGTKNLQMDYVYERTYIDIDIKKPKLVNITVSQKDLDTLESALGLLEQMGFGDICSKEYVEALKTYDKLTDFTTEVYTKLNKHKA